MTQRGTPCRFPAGECPHHARGSAAAPAPAGDAPVCVAPVAPAPPPPSLAASPELCGATTRLGAPCRIAAGECPHHARRKDKVELRFGGHDEDAWRSALKDLLRDTVTRHRGALVERQRGDGAYSLRSLAGQRVVVDHVFECQAMGAAFLQAAFRDGRPRALLRGVLANVDWGARSGDGTLLVARQPFVVQGALAHAREVHNAPDFLAATDALSNTKKAAAFKTALGQLEGGGHARRGLEAELERAFSAPRAVCPFSPEDAARSARAVVSRLRDMEDGLDARLRDVPRGAAQDDAARADAYGDVADEVRTLYEAFGITSRV